MKNSIYQNTHDKKFNWTRTVRIIGLISFVVFGLTSCDNQKPSEREIAEKVQEEKQQLMCEMEEMQAVIDRSYAKLEDKLRVANDEAKPEIEKLQNELDEEREEIGKMMMDVNRTAQVNWEEVKHNTEMSLEKADKEFENLKAELASHWEKDKNS